MNRTNGQHNRKLLLARAVSFYCLLAVVTCVVLATRLQGQIVPLRQTAARLKEDLDRRQPALDRAEAEYSTLVSEQERDRSSYGGPQAVEMSVKVLAAKQSSADLRAEFQRVQADQQAAADSAQTLSVRFVPLLALGILHAIALAMILAANPRLFTRG